MSKGLFTPRRPKKRYSLFRTLITLCAAGTIGYQFIPEDIIGHERTSQSSVEVGAPTIVYSQVKDTKKVDALEHTNRDLEKRLDECTARPVVIKKEQLFDKVSKEYAVAILDKTSAVPIKINKELYSYVSDFRKIKDKKERAKAIFDWELKHITYGDSKRYGKVGYRDAVETWKDKQGVCGELAYLYTAMARASGIDARLVDVKRNPLGKKVAHMCVAVSIDGTETLVDPAYRTFGIRHTEISYVGDSKAREHFSGWRKKLNNRCGS